MILSEQTGTPQRDIRRDAMAERRAKAGEFMALYLDAQNRL